MDDDALLENYVSRVLDMQKQSRQSLRDLDAIAGELGLSDAEIAQIRTHVEDSLLRSRQYLKTSMFQEAVAEAMKAHELSPWDADICVLLGAIYEAWSKRKFFPGRLHSEARRWYKTAIELDPKHQRAFIGLQNLAKKRQAALRTRIIFIIGIVVSFYIVGILSDEKTKHNSVPAERGPSGVTSSAEAASETTRAVETNTIPDHETIPVVTDFNLGSTGIAFEAQASSLNRYNSGKASFSCDIRGLFKVEGREVYKLSVKAVWYDREGKSFREKSMSVVDSYSAPLKPGEILPVRILEYNEGTVPSLSRVVLSIDEIDADTSSAMSSGKSIPVVWKVAKSDGVELEAYLRSQNTASGTKDYIVKSILVFKNTGTSRIQFISMRPVFKKNGMTVKVGTDRIVLMRDNAFLPPEMKFPFLILDSFSKSENPDPSALFDSMELEVVSLE